MSRTPNVSTNVPANVPRRLPPPRKASYLVGDPSGWRFQMRLPASIRTADTFLAKSASTLRFRIGPMSRRAAEQQAGLYATIRRAVFAAAPKAQGLTESGLQRLIRTVPTLRCHTGGGPDA